MDNIKFIDDYSIENKTTLLRLDLNVPLNDNKVSDYTRIDNTLPTIKLLLDRDNKIIILSHLGRPKGFDPTLTLRILLPYFQEKFPNHIVSFAENLEDLKIKTKETNNIIIFENTRFFPEEKTNGAHFINALAECGHIYVNDAFSVCHREEATTVGLPKILPGYGGLLLKKEITNINLVINNPEKPLVAVLGGSKISTKLGLIKRLLEVCDHILLGGGLANTLLKAKGVEIGSSLVEEDMLSSAMEILKESGNKLLLPVDCVVGKLNDQHFSEIVSLDNIQENQLIYDIGPKTIKSYSDTIASSKTIVWNGPVGMFEDDKFKNGTLEIYKEIIKNNNCKSIIGGGDTLSAIKNENGKDKITYISTAGGAMLEYLEKGSLPAIEALKSNG